MITVFACLICGAESETEEPAQCFTAWCEINCAWELICDDCADSAACDTITKAAQ